MYREIIDGILSGEITTPRDLALAKRRVAAEHGLSKIPSNADILAEATEREREILEPFLRLKPTRTMSGVTVVAVMTSPYPCPHGRCIYCPGGPERGTAQSYTGREPAALRAAQHDFDPYKQVRARLRQLEEIGHPVDKIDLIIMGGTFTARPREYQEWFVRRCFDAMNGVSSADLVDAHRKNERARHRCIGLTVETRPDWFMEEEIDFAISLGATRVELGVQTTFDSVLEKVRRGHSTEETRRSTRLARDRGLKICYHMMPGLPGSTPEMDLAAFRTIFSDPGYMPDMLKIYPTLVVEGTDLYEMWKRGEYEPLSTEEAARLVARVKAIVPPWVRIQRIQRDIPSHLVVAGVKKSNLRQIALEKLSEMGGRCQCIRCREVGRAPEDVQRALENVDAGSMDQVTYEYEAGGGKEFFMEVGVDGYVVGFARLRFPSEESPFRDLALVRELKVFGREVPLEGGITGGASSGGPGEDRAWQHRGVGRYLMSLAEEKAREGGFGGVRVTSGVGVRDYYRKLGYRQVGMGMVKKF